MINGLSLYMDWGSLLLRLVIGAIFLAHGLPKIKNLRETSTNFQAMGFRPGGFWGTIVALLEPIGGVFLILGLATELIALLLAIQMVVATIFNIRNGRPFKGGYELDMLLVAALLMLATHGAGAHSIDASWNIQLW